MARNKSKKLPPFESLDQLVHFFETTDMSDYLDEMPEVNFDIDLKRRTHLVALDEKLVDELDAIAKSRKTSSEKLVNLWIKEKLSKAS